MKAKSTAKMGYESNKRIVKVYNNQRVTAEFNGRTCNFRSKFEYNWALYLQFLKESGEIITWDYEVRKFYFKDEETPPVQYTPDFWIFESSDSNYYQECKGYHDGATNRKLQRLAKHYPDVVIELVLMRMPKWNKTKGANRRRVAEKYCRRIIDASEIFKQIKGLVKLI